MAKTFKSISLHSLFVFAPMADGKQLNFDIGKRYAKRSARTYQQVDATGGAQGICFKVGSINIEVQDASPSVSYEMQKVMAQRMPANANRFRIEGQVSAMNGNTRTPGNEYRMPVFGMGRSWQAKEFARGFSEQCAAMGRTVLKGD